MKQQEISAEKSQRMRHFLTIVNEDANLLKRLAQ